MQELLLEHLGSVDFVRAALSGPTDAEIPWSRITLRPIVVKGWELLQISRYDGNKTYVTNVAPSDEELAQLRGSAFRHLTIILRDRKIEARVSRRGRLAVWETSEQSERNTDHDRRKRRIVPEDAAFLEVVGLASHGKVTPSSQRKFRQINEFLRYIDEAPGIQDILSRPVVRVIDFGSGNAYLTFAIYYYLAVVKGNGASVIGVDRDASAVHRAQGCAGRLGWDHVRFRVGDISAFDLGEERPDIVVALHACDTATDDALAAAAAADVSLVLVSPCCHHDLQRQLRPSTTPANYASLIREGMLKERFGEVLTDALRCELLSAVGYRTDVIQFVGVEHSARNLLIRAVRTADAPIQERMARYRDLRDEWNVRPYLEGALERRLHREVTQETSTPAGEQSSS